MHSGGVWREDGAIGGGGSQWATAMSSAKRADVWCVRVWFFGLFSCSCAVCFCLAVVVCALLFPHGGCVLRGVGL